MKFTILCTLFFVSSLVLATDYKGSRFSSVWNQVTSDAYTELPHEVVELGDFFNFGADLLLRSAVRTVNNQNDLLPRFNKLLHPNGICLKGIWSITATSKYSGYFKKNSTALIVSRASVALSETEKGSYRGFGLAGKLFATTDEKNQNLLKTANFFTIDDLGGTRADSFLQAELTNQPKVTVRIGSIFSADVATAAAVALGRADQNPLKRQVYQISELGLKKDEKLIVPQLMKLSATVGQKKNGVADFREEVLEQINATGFIQFDISVADNNGPFKKIGNIKYTEAILSESCDHRLHFHHPKFLNEVE